nr:Chain C, MP-21HXL_D Chain D, MP-2
RCCHPQCGMAEECR